MDHMFKNMLFWSQITNLYMLTKSGCSRWWQYCLSNGSHLGNEFAVFFII